ncbi:hypothetical protein B0J11DRAFT_582319 [Dendryphion nanum]|uniref:Uncharacterized protein n=1 Tax=Dendryphion nanum TaxID=256645 RepID=A0A9P9DJM2_9PLEO|nr:hypothetical protein B0J11DRAFT_582319 [Dendryphion nanum]
MSAEWHIAQPFCLALGPQHNSPEPIWYCGAKVVNGEEKIMYSQQHFESNYPELSRWGRTIPSGARNCRVTFGSAPFSFFACAPGHGSVWAAVSSELTDKVQKAFETPSCVALGVGEAWYVAWPHGSSAWNFHGAYGELNQILNDAAPRLVTHLAISPYNSQHYFVVFNDNTVRYNFAGVPEWQAPVNEVMQMWHADLMQRQSMQPQFLAVQPPPPPPQQYNNYTHVPPPAGAPVYVAAHYANAHSPPPGMPPYNVYGNGMGNGIGIGNGSAPNAFVAELPAEIPTNFVAPPISQPVAVPVAPINYPAQLAPTLSAAAKPPEKKRKSFFSKFKS